MLRARLLAPLLVTALIAGCVAPDAPNGPEGDPAPAPSVADRLALDMATLPCEPSYQHGESSGIFREIYHYESPDEVRYGEIDVIDGTDLVVFSRYSSDGFTILNVSNPYAPELVSDFPEGGFALDVKVSTDGKTAYTGGFGSISVIDITDPYTPNLTRTVLYPEPFRSQMAQAHMLHVADIGGTDYVFAATQWHQGVLIFKAVGEPGDVDLEYLTVFAPAVGGPLAAHDMMVYHDPVEKKPILWVANGFGGFIAADVSDPAIPVPVSWDIEKDPYQGYTHTISVTHYGDKRYAVTMAEIGAMALKVFDVTNMAAPVLLATWTIEDLPTSTQHNTQIMGDWLWLGHYGEGVVLFNLKEELASLTLPAYNLGVLPVEGLDPYAQYKPESGSTWEMVVVNGVMWTTSGGIYGALNGCFEAGNTTLRAYV